jgi:hypothetical protein
MPEPEKRRYVRKEPLDAQPDLKIKLQTASGTVTAINARLLDINDGGVSVEVPTLLAPGLLVEIEGEVENVVGKYMLRRKSRVCRCSRNEDGKYVVGLSFETSNENGQGQFRGDVPDYYEILQLSRNADHDTIQRIFRMVAQRYHPDNQETGNADLFRQMVEAHRVLSDPEQRAAYDAKLSGRDQNRFKIFETVESSRGVEAEKRKRQGILSLLYGKRVTDPHQPAMAVRDFEQMLGCPREHLEFSLWYLKENKWITRSDNNKFEITWQGVAVVEAEGDSDARPGLPQLPAPASE